MAMKDKRNYIIEESIKKSACASKSQNTFFLSSSFSEDAEDIE
jgi:hypothetical protein